MKPVASIIIVTRNRAHHLRETLRSLREMQVPKDVPTELFVLDNGSTDDTKAVVESVAQNSPFAVRYHSETTPGKSRSCNVAIAKAQGDVLLWTDDDVRVPQNWVSLLTTPILGGDADGVGAPVRLAPELTRPWMTRTHYDRLADDRFSEQHGMVGANKAFHRRILDKIDGYDPEIGPGALGTWDDALLFYKFTTAGYRMTYVPEAGIEHHFEESRLQYGSWLKSGVIGGRSLSYIEYHWSHAPRNRIALRVRFWKLALAAYRLAKPPPKDPQAEGCDRREIRMVDNLAFYEYWHDHCLGKPRNYDKNGLVKRVNPFRIPSPA